MWNLITQTYSDIENCRIRRIDHWSNLLICWPSAITYLHFSAISANRSTISAKCSPFTAFPNEWHFSTRYCYELLTSDIRERKLRITLFIVLHWLFLWHLPSSLCAHNRDVYTRISRKALFNTRTVSFDLTDTLVNFCLEWIIMWKLKKWTQKRKRAKATASLSAVFVAT